MAHVELTHDIGTACISIYMQGTHCELSCMFTCTHKCDSSSKCGSVKHSIALHSVASSWSEFQCTALRVIHLCACV